MAKGNVLMIGENPPGVAFLRFVLGESGYSLLLTSVADALPLDPDAAPAAILIPLLGPDGADLALCRQVHADPLAGDIPILALCDKRAETHPAAPLVDAWLSPPFHCGDLIALLERPPSAARRTNSTADAAPAQLNPRRAATRSAQG
jgi:CheY-like chemotaxis protein